MSSKKKTKKSKSYFNRSITYLKSRKFKRLRGNIAGNLQGFAQAGHKFSGNYGNALNSAIFGEEEEHHPKKKKIGGVPDFGKMDFGL